MKALRFILCSALTLLLAVASQPIHSATPGAKQTRPGSAAAAADAVTLAPDRVISVRPSGLRTSWRPETTSATPRNAAEVQKRAASTKETYFYGSLIYSNEWGGDNSPYGIYRMPLSSPNSIESVHLDSKLNANAGAVYAEGKFCFVNFYESFGAIIAYYYVYDATTWELLQSNRVSNTSIATDMTYDPTSRTIYGCFQNSTRDGYVFGSMDASNGDVEAISNLNAPFFCVAANSKGEIYGVQGDGCLYKIDKSIGSWTEIGDTGLRPVWSQSATFDLKNDKMYWAACTNTTAGLFEVDITTGNASLVKKFDHMEEWGGLYIPDPEAADAAPDGVENLTVSYIPTTASDLQVSFTMPTTTYDGSSELSGDIDYVVSINGQDKDIKTAKAGGSVSFIFGNSEVGEVTVGITTLSDAGRGPTRKCTLWVGKDFPNAPTDVKWSVIGSNQVSLSWTAPTTGWHDGYIDPSKLTYKIVRRPDNKVIADGITSTSFVDDTEVEKLSYYYYDITSVCNGLTGGTASTGKIVVGDAFTVPYAEYFNNESDFELFTVIDANGDGQTWLYDYRLCAGSSFSLTRDMDDWLITPPIRLGNDRLYKLSFQANASAEFTELFSVALGDEATVEAMTTELLPTTPISGVNKREYTAIIRTAEAKPYYIGFHKTSPSDRSGLCIDDIMVTEGAMLAAPDAAANFKAVAGAQGAKTATLSFDVPTHTIGGDPLPASSIEAIYLYRDNTIIKQFKPADIAANKTLEFTDDNPFLGMNYYKVVAKNGYGNGLEAGTEVFVGVDEPGLPTNVRLTEVDGKAHLTWDAPTEGKHGGYFDPENLGYIVAVPYNGDLLVLSGNTPITETSFDYEVSFSSQQESFAFYVFAKSTGGMGSGQRSNELVMGTPYDLPLYESFPDAYPEQVWWIDIPEGQEGYWQSNAYGTLPTTDAQDLDGGLLTFSPSSVGDEGTIYTGKLSTAKTEEPTFEFYYYHKRGSQDHFDVIVTNNGVDWEVARTITFADPALANGWVLATVPLKKYATTDFIMVGLHVYSADGITNFHFDNLAIRQIYPQDLEAGKIYAPSKLGIGSQAGVSATVINRGSETSGDFEVQLYRNGTSVATLGGTGLAPGESKLFSFPQTADKSFGKEVSYYAVVNYAADRFIDNNTSETVKVAISRPDCPAVDDLEASVTDGTATLTWSTPDYKRTHDGFETYTPFIISGIGEWTTLDKDGYETVIIGGMSNEQLWPNAYEPQAWIVFNPSALNVDVNDDGSPSIFATHSGDQMLVSFASDSGRDNDWLISPLLNGKAQTISFYIKSATDYYGGEEYEFLTSTSSIVDINSFEVVESDDNVSDEWTLVNIDVPAGATYFAIRNVGTNHYALCVDDISYAPASAAEMELEGFNVFCNGEKLNGDEPVKGNTYTVDNIDENEKYVFTVTVVYTEGESDSSNEAIVGNTGVNDFGADAAKVYGCRGAIVILNADGKEFTAYATDGKALVRGVAHGTTCVNARPGIYLVKLGGKAHKVLVK